MMDEPTYTKDRNRVAKIAATDPNEALRIARGIQEPWFRCQALAHVANHTSDIPKKNTLLDEAFQVALKLNDLNRIVSVSAWPLKVLSESPQNEKLQKEVDRLLDLISKEPSPVRRADALNLILGAVVNGPLSVFWQVFDVFKSACLSLLLNGKRNAKGQSALCEWVPVVHRLDETKAQEVINSIEGPTLRERALELIQKHKDTDLHLLISWPNIN